MTPEAQEVIDRALEVYGKLEAGIAAQRGGSYGEATTIAACSMFPGVWRLLWQPTLMIGDPE